MYFMPATGLVGLGASEGVRLGQEVQPVQRHLPDDLGGDHRPVDADPKIRSRPRNSGPRPARPTGTASVITDGRVTLVRRALCPACYTRRYMDLARNQHARQLFDGIAHNYDLPASLLSFFQYEKWRRHLVRRLDPAPGHLVMDLCTGTAGGAAEMVKSAGCRVVGIDLSTGMLQHARSRINEAVLQDDIRLARARAESLPFVDGRFDAVCFTFLLRYVDDPETTIKEIVRVLRPGGRLASLEFAIPESRALRALWHIYARGVLPVATAPMSVGWRRVGAFLGASISRFYRSWSVERLRDTWVDSGMLDVRIERLSFGSAVVMWGTKK